MGWVTHSDFETLKGKIKNKSVVLVVPVPSDDEAGETMNQRVRLKDLMSTCRHPFHVEQEGRSFFQVPMKITANNIGLLDGEAAVEIKVNSETLGQQMLLSHTNALFAEMCFFLGNEMSCPWRRISTRPLKVFHFSMFATALNGWRPSLNVTPINWHNCNISLLQSKQSPAGN